MFSGDTGLEFRDLSNHTLHWMTLQAKWLQTIIVYMLEMFSQKTLANVNSNWQCRTQGHRQGGQTDGFTVNRGASSFILTGCLPVFAD